jgi:hypothetical protein
MRISADDFTRPPTSRQKLRDQATQLGSRNSIAMDGSHLWSAGGPRAAPAQRFYRNTARRIVCQSQGKSTGNYSVSSRGHVRRSTSGSEMPGAIAGRVERRTKREGVAGAAASETPHFLSKHRSNHQDDFRETSLCSDGQLKSRRCLCSEALEQLRLCVRKSQGETNDTHKLSSPVLV